VRLEHRAFLLRPGERERTFTSYHLGHRQAARDLSGLPFDLPPVGTRYPISSWPALEAAEWVKRRHREQFDEFDLAIYDAFFRETRDIGDPAVLGDLAERLGLRREALERSLAAREYREAVWEENEEALRLGISSIPTVIIGDAHISGAVPYQQYLAAARTALA
jgi:predicted DsbA family dithiol-disulfide isomerase